MEIEFGGESWEEKVGGGEKGADWWSTETIMSERESERDNKQGVETKTE